MTVNCHVTLALLSSNNVISRIVLWKRENENKKGEIILSIVDMSKFLHIPVISAGEKFRDKETLSSLLQFNLQWFSLLLFIKQQSFLDDSLETLY